MAAKSCCRFSSQRKRPNKKGQPLPAVILDAKGNIELEDYYFRAKLTVPTKAHPGESVQVQIDSIDPEKGEARFRLA